MFAEQRRGESGGERHDVRGTPDIGVDAGAVDGVPCRLRDGIDRAEFQTGGADGFADRAVAALDRAVEQRRLDEGGDDRPHPDAVSRPFGVERLGQPTHREFGG